MKVEFEPAAHAPRRSGRRAARWPRRAILFGALLLGGLVRAEPAGAPAAEMTGEAWELRLLGVGDEALLAKVRAAAQARPVTLALVGMGGVSEAGLAPLLTDGNTLAYCEGATDPGGETHDTRQLRFVLRRANAVGVKIHLLVYQPNSYEAAGAALRLAAERADLVLFYHSFWGGKVPAMMAQVRRHGDALFLCPYAEVQGRPTATCSQAFAAHPDGSGIRHLATCIPLPRTTGGALIHPLCRDARDSETINFIAPSYYATSVGDSCLATGVVTSVAAYVVAASSVKPTPERIFDLMRRSAAVDPAALTSVPEFDAAAVEKLQNEIDFLVKPDALGIRRLDAPGVLNVGTIYRELTAEKNAPTP